MKVYVAGSSREMTRARRAMDFLRYHGVEITHDWVAQITEVGEANPRTATNKERRHWSSADLKGVEDSELVLVLVPDEATGRGAYFEAGYATALGRVMLYAGDTRQSIFPSQGREYASDEEALDAVLECHFALEFQEQLSWQW